MNGTEIELNVSILSTRDYVKQNEVNAYINNVDEAMLKY